MKFNLQINFEIYLHGEQPKDDYMGVIDHDTYDNRFIHYLSKLVN